ncbi:hypothetical protein SK128_018369 [Halocaridina rubra]|uniref:Uncharacterized protein n=1 Tax=Halocaridina rubra TaxID=373956 RepID=A0AAN8X9S8_HALRR
MLRHTSRNYDVLSEEVDFVLAHIRDIYPQHHTQTQTSTRRKSRKDRKAAGAAPKEVPYRSLAHKEIDFSEAGNICGSKITYRVKIGKRRQLIFPEQKIMAGSNANILNKSSNAKTEKKRQRIIPAYKMVAGSNADIWNKSSKVMKANRRQRILSGHKKVAGSNANILKKNSKVKIQNKRRRIIPAHKMVSKRYKIRGASDKNTLSKSSIFKDFHATKKNWNQKGRHSANKIPRKYKKRRGRRKNKRNIYVTSIQCLPSTLPNIECVPLTYGSYLTVSCVPVKISQAQHIMGTPIDY